VGRLARAVIRASAGVALDTDRARRTRPWVLITDGIEVGSVPDHSV